MTPMDPGLRLLLEAEGPSGGPKRCWKSYVFSLPPRTQQGGSLLHFGNTDRTFNCSVVDLPFDTTFSLSRNVFCRLWSAKVSVQFLCGIKLGLRDCKTAGSSGLQFLLLD